MKLRAHDGKTSIKVIKNASGLYVLHRFELKYDSAEDAYYEVRVRPDPKGFFDTEDRAAEEANRILDKETN